MWVSEWFVRKKKNLTQSDHHDDHDLVIEQMVHFNKWLNG